MSYYDHNLNQPAYGVQQGAYPGYPPPRQPSPYQEHPNAGGPSGPGGFLMPTPGFAPPVPGPRPGSSNGTYPNLSGYDAPSHIPSYAPPPAGSPYAPPPPEKYGAPPSYGAESYQAAAYPPPQQQFYYLGTILPSRTSSSLPDQQATYNAEKIRSATKGFGTDESALIAVMASLDAFQADSLCKKFESTYGKNLVSVLEKETSSWFRLGLTGIAHGPLGWDVEMVHRALSGIGTHEDLLNEILLCRTNDELRILKDAYRAKYHHHLDADVKGDLSGKTERLFNMVLTAQRQHDSVPVNQSEVDSDVLALYKAGQGRAGTDEIAFCHIMTSRSQRHLVALGDAYHRKHKVKLTRLIKNEFSGHMKDALLYIAEGAKHDGRGIHRDVKLLEKAMAGLGTKDERLVWRIVRAHWDRNRMEEIKRAYQAKYGKTLVARVQGETRGDYRKLMVALIGS